MNYLESIDWLIIAVYLAGIIAFGVWIGKGQKTTQDYFLGGRNIPWWGVGLSIVATETSALTFIGVPALAYGGDLSFIQVIVGYVIARLILAALMVPHYLKREIYSPYQILANAFGPGAQRLAGAFFLLGGTLAAGVRVYVTCIPIQLMLETENWIPQFVRHAGRAVPGADGILLAILLFVGLSLIYTYVGGIKAVVWTDAVQFGLFMLGGLFTLVYVPLVMDAGWDGAMAQAAKAGKLDWLNTKFSLAMPFNLWMGVFGATAQVMASHGADQLIVQRVLTCKSVSEGRKALVLSAVIILPLFLLFLLTGTMLWAFYQEFPVGMAIPATKAGLSKHDYIYPIFMLTAVPSGIKGFLIVAILAAAMSSVSSALSALASVSTMDFLRGWLARGGREQHALRFSKYSTLFWAAMLVLVAYASREAPFVFNLAFSLNGLTSGAMLGGLLLALLWKNGRASPVVLGMLASLAVMAVISLRFKAEIAWPWFTLIGTSVTLLVAWLTRMLQRAPQPPAPTATQS